jgi:tyrosyl-tRNA synthetase
MSFTEFTYQLLQGYDFVYLNEHKNCKLQMGGSDQWGNITTGTELIKKITGNEAFALTCPLITKADGGKFGKTESGNVWLSRKYTSPYKFFQFWMNVSDDDAKRYIKIFTSLSREEIESLIAEHDAAPHLRVLQKRLAKEVTCMVHSEEDYNKAVEATNILFGNTTHETLCALSDERFMEIFGENVESYEIPMEDLKAGIGPLDLLAERTTIFPSKGEARKMIQQNGFSLNKEKLTDPATPLTDANLLNGKYLLFQKGKKNYYLVVAK